VKVYGVLGERSTFRSSRINQTLFVNKRYVKDPGINQAIESAYGSVLMKGKFPFYVIYIDVNTQTVDVNVHPQKLYVKFSNQKEVRSAIYEAVKTFSRSLGSVPEIMFNEEASQQAQKPIRKAFSFESKNTQHKEITREKADDDIKENGEKVSPVIEDMQPKTYDYKKELEFLNSIKQPSKLKQTFTPTVDVDTEPAVIKMKEEPEQRSYLDEEAQAKIIGVAFDTYVIVEHGEDLYLIDQHAAHERLIYEKLLDQFMHENVVSQHLLIPQDNKITYEEKNLLNDYIPQLEKLGFNLEFPDELTVSIKSVPHLLGQPRFSSFFIELFDILREESNRNELSVIQKIISMSCKKAIKAGDKLSHPEISLLIKGIKDEEIPLTCPHGRPFVMKLTKHQIDKKAGRIV
jgi:DNA mismatch repair protein MutL